MIHRWDMDEHALAYLEKNSPIPHSFKNKEDFADYLAAVKHAAKKNNVPEPSWLKGWLITDLSAMTYEEDLELVEEPEPRFVLRKTA